MLIDTHAHLSDSVYDESSIRFGGISYNKIIADMKENGLSKIISVGYDLASSQISKEIAQKNQDVFFSCGLHPSEANDVATLDTDFCQQLIALAKHPKCVAIGEIGLDYHYDNHDKLCQREILIRQMQVVKQCNLPVIFHVRDADGDMLEIVKANLSLLPKCGVMHCFSGSKQTALQYIDMGFYISFSGSITFKNAVKFPEIISALPKDRILVETDCPYLAPQAMRGKINYPQYVQHTANKVADILGISLDEIAQLTTANAKRLFNFN